MPKQVRHDIRDWMDGYAVRGCGSEIKSNEFDFASLALHSFLRHFVAQDDVRAGMTYGTASRGVAGRRAPARDVNPESWTQLSRNLWLSIEKNGNWSQNYTRTD